MQFRTSTLRFAATAIASLGLLTACENSETLGAPYAPPVRTTLALEVSGAAVANGQRVAVAIVNGSAEEIGGVQGFLRFDASKLRYRGQTRDAGSTEIMLVNDKAADRGEIRLAVMNGAGVRRTSPLVFEVIGGGYASSLSFDVEEAAKNGSPVVAVNATMADGYQVNSMLSASDDATRISVEDWMSILQPGSRFAALNPGEVVNGLKYGDTNLNGALSLTDALYIINVSVGLNEMIVGTDGSGIGDRDAVVAGNVFPFNDADGGLGEAADPTPPGRDASGTRTLTLGDGLAILNESVGLNQPIVGEIIPGRPVVPATNRIVVNANVTTNTTWTNGNIYELQGGITVTNGATLTIEPGTQIEGQQGSGPGVGGAALFVARDGMINATGTPLQPIVMTCVVGTGRFKGCWGGVSILGNASSNEGTNTSPIVPGRSATAGCKERNAEGNAGLYGGCNDADNSGTIKYVRIEYAGFRFTTTNELNGLALYGVGNGTTVDFVQVHAGLDDGIEMFGGTVNLKHIVSTANQDDSFDYTEGWNGKAQFIIVQHDSLDSDKGFENDNNTTTPDALPRSTPTIYNATLVGKASVSSGSGTPNNNSVGGMHVRVGAQPKYFNFLIQNFPWALDIDNTQTCTNFGTTGFELKNSIFAANGRLDEPDAGDPAGCGATEVDAILLAGSNNTNVATSPLISPLNVLVPDFRPAFGTATGGATPPNDGFFDATATYIGAVPPANATKSNIPWYAGWTRGWTTATTP